MDNRFFEKPILNSPYKYPKFHWELDKDGQPTQKIINKRRSAEFISPIPKPRKRKKSDPKQTQLDFGTDEGLSTVKQRYDPTPVINKLRRQVDMWRSIPNPGDWRVTPETARLLQHWRHHRFNDIRPFGEPDIEILEAEENQIRVKIMGVDVFHPQTGEVRSDGPEGIACWFVDTDYNEESFFVRQAYFLGASDPYKALKTTLKAEINAEAWETLNSETSRPFDKPESGRIAVKVINHLGDEVMKVFKVPK